MTEQCPKCGSHSHATAIVNGDTAYICMNLECGHAWWADDGESCELREEPTS